MRTIAIVLFITCLLVSCMKPGPEPVASASYRVSCQLGTGLHISAQDFAGQVVLLTDTVPPGATAEIMQVTECSGGHVFPSNFLTNLSISTSDSTGTYEVYTGVHNGDWAMMEGDDARTVLVLAVP